MEAIDLSQYGKNLAPNVLFDATDNVKQQEFIKVALQCASGDLPYRFLFYGGAVRGGKTSVAMQLAIMFSQFYPKTIGTILRKDLAVLEATTKRSFFKFCPREIIHKTNELKKTVEFKNGSMIRFMGENYHRDKNATKFLGLEGNYYILDQAEEFQEQTFDYIIQRCGSERTQSAKEMKPLIICTFNPTFTWVKNRIYDKYVAGELKPPYYFLPALPTDNKFVTPDQFEVWKQMDEISYRRFIEGDWEAMDTTGRVAYAFSISKHVSHAAKIDKSKPIYLSFDFNVNPITCIVAQHGEGWIHICKEYALPNSNIYELCRLIKKDYPNAHFIVTGDAAGRQRSALTDGNYTYISVIRTQLQISQIQSRFPTHNPPVEGSAVVLNTLFERYPKFYINPACKELIADLMSVKWKEQNTDKPSIDKSDTKRTHLLDCLRYYVSTFHPKVVKM